MGDRNQKQIERIGVNGMPPLGEDMPPLQEEQEVLLENESAVPESNEYSDARTSVDVQRALAMIHASELSASKAIYQIHSDQVLLRCELFSVVLLLSIPAVWLLGRTIIPKHASSRAPDNASTTPLLHSGHYLPTELDSASALL